MRPNIDLTGQVFDRLVVLRRAPNGSGGVRWDCQCSCGALVTCSTSNLRRGSHRSCGCLRRETFAARGTERKASDPTNLRGTWASIKHRCHNPAGQHYKDYGGRGIGLYPAWLDDRAEFERWVLDNLGPRPPKHSLDRIDNNRGYEPGNLRWATQKEQMANTRAKVSNAQLAEMTAERDLWRQRAIELGWRTR